MISIPYSRIIVALIATFVFANPVISTKLGHKCRDNHGCNRGDDTKALFCQPTSEVCECAVGNFNETTCIPWKNDGESCGNSSECNQHRGLNCIDGVCRCDPTTQFQNLWFFSAIDNLRVEPGYCVSKLGFNCSVKKVRDGNAFNRFCLVGADCADGTCSCTKGSRNKTESGQCGAVHGQRCSNNDVCADNLRCVSSKHGETTRCQCPHPNYQEFNPKTGTCQSSLDSPCDKNATKPCIEGAECVGSKLNPGLFTCRCGNGTVENKDGKCQVQHGFPCKYYNFNDNAVCNEEAGLVCKGDHGYFNPEFKCSCANDVDVFESIRNRCLKPVGVKCTESNSNSCTSNAECEMKTGRKWGICTCNLERFTVTSDGLCQPKPT